MQIRDKRALKISRWIVFGLSESVSIREETEIRLPQLPFAPPNTSNNSLSLLKRGESGTESRRRSRWCRHSHGIAFLCDQVAYITGKDSSRVGSAGKRMRKNRVLLLCAARKIRWGLLRSLPHFRGRVMLSRGGGEGLFCRRG